MQPAAVAAAPVGAVDIVVPQVPVLLLFACSSLRMLLLPLARTLLLSVKPSVTPWASSLRLLLPLEGGPAGQ